MREGEGWRERQGRGRGTGCGHVLVAFNVGGLRMMLDGEKDGLDFLHGTRQQLTQMFIPQALWLL